jgi:predicted butyrate kinase (DUF1464 family)
MGLTGTVAAGALDGELPMSMDNISYRIGRRRLWLVGDLRRTGVDKSATGTQSREFAYVQMYLVVRVMAGEVTG